jgi:hypothetical protein
MSKDELDTEDEADLDAADLDAEDLEAEDLDEDDEDLDADLDLDDAADGDLDPELLADGESAVAVATETAAPAGDEEDEEVLDLDEELHPDDVEAPLDALLEEKTAAATMDEEEEELEEDEPEGDERGEGPTRIVPRRADEFQCMSCYLVLPRTQLADEARMLCRDCA